jgi:hypothetical protein
MWGTFAFLYFGNPVPTTYYAKTTSHVSIVNTVVGRQIAMVFASGALGSLLAISIGLFHHRNWPVHKKFMRLLANHAVLSAVPLLLLSFYYLKTTYLQSPARYLLPSMATLPLIAALVTQRCKSNEKSGWVQAVFIAAALVQVSTSMYLTLARTAPVLRRFNSTYGRAMHNTADRLAKLVDYPDDRVLVVIDIGALSFYGDGRFTVVDAGALASPQMLGLKLDEMIARSEAGLVVESLGRTPGGLGKAISLPETALIHIEPFPSMSMAHPWRTYYANLYDLRD